MSLGEDRLPCHLVAHDGLKLGANQWPTCLNIVRCCDEGCMWRAFHGIPQGKMCVKPEKSK